MTTKERYLLRKSAHRCPRCGYKLLEDYHFAYCEFCRRRYEIWKHSHEIAKEFNISLGANPFLTVTPDELDRNIAEATKKLESFPSIKKNRMKRKSPKV